MICLFSFQVQGRTSLAPPRPPTRQTRYIPAPSSTSNSAPAPGPSARPLVLQLQPPKQRLPLHMSTPCDPPRSILKAISPKVRSLSAAKKVNFDNLPDEGICPLEDLTIQDIPRLEIKKTTKVDASTNTEPEMSASSEIVPTGEDTALKSFMISIESRLTNIENTLQLLVNDNRSNHTAILLENQVKTVHKFMSNLDDIREDRESITPSLQEKTETPSNLQATDTVTPGSEVANTDATPFLTRVSPKQTVSLAPEVLEEEGEKEDSEKEVSAVVESSPVSDGPKRRSTRSQSTEVTLQATKMEGSKLRNIRKRGVPRYLESFELSPKPTKPKTRRDRD